jgi:biopolymer transport protein TolR
MSAQQPRGVMAEINVTPLVDVMLVLLIIFMVTAPLLDQGIDVRLPKASTATSAGSSGLVITLNKDHLVYVDDELMTMKELRDRLSKTSHSTNVLIRADRHAYVDKLIALWDLCRAVGIQSVHIVTLPE